MKLSKEEIEAIAHKVYVTISSNRREKVKDICASEAYQNPKKSTEELQTIVKLVKAKKKVSRLSEELGLPVLSNTEGTVASDLIKSLVMSKQKKLLNSIPLYTKEDIIATITLIPEVENVNILIKDLIKDLINQYS